MVKALDRKLLRDLWRLRGQMLAICVLVACAAASYVSSISTYHSLGRSQESYYEHYRFADVFAQLKRAPESLARRVEQTAGVATVETRVVEDVRLDVPGVSEPAMGRIVSIPEQGPPRINRLYLRAGRWPDPAATDEVLVSEAFMVAHALQPGQHLTAILNGRSQRLQIVGVALSPEYVYAIQPGSMVPDDKRFGVLWMTRRALAPAIDLDGAFNDVVVRLQHGAFEPQVVASLDELLAPYGGLGAYGRHNQTSHRYVSDEIQSLRSTGLTVPPIFLAVASFLLNVVLSRLVATQREQIATLKALGYGTGAVALHYGKMVLVVVALGLALGALLGAWAGHAMTGLYTNYFRFPSLTYQLRPSVVAAAAAVCGLAAVLGVAGAVRRAVSLPPAEAMRPAVPAGFHRSWLEVTGISRLLAPTGRMIARNLARRPIRTLLSSLGMGLAAAILLVGSFFMDALNFIMDVQFNFAQRDDLMVTFTDVRPERAVRELEHMPGVLYAEPFRLIPVKLRAAHRQRRTVLLALSEQGRLRRLLDEDLHKRQVPEQGLMLTDKLAQVLAVRVGDRLQVEALEGHRPVRQMLVAEVIREPVGTAAYASLAYANGWMRESSLVSGAYVAIDEARSAELLAALKTMPAVAGVTMHSALVESFEQTSQQYLRVFSVILVAFAVVIVAAVVYNSGRIALAERERELASLRVIGFTRGEISLMLLGELAVQVVLSIPLGFVVGCGMSAGIARAFDSELYRIPVVIEPDTYGFAAVVVLVAAALTSVLVRRKLDRLDLVSVLKTRE